MRGHDNKKTLLPLICLCFVLHTVTIYMSRRVKCELGPDDSLGRNRRTCRYGRYAVYADVGAKGGCDEASRPFGDGKKVRGRKLYARHISYVDDLHELSSTHDSLTALSRILRGTIFWAIKTGRDIAVHFHIGTLMIQLTKCRLTTLCAYLAG